MKFCVKNKRETLGFRDSIGARIPGKGSCFSCVFIVYNMHCIAQFVLYENFPCLCYELPIVLLCCAIA